MFLIQYIFQNRSGKLGSARLIYRKATNHNLYTKRNSLAEDSSTKNDLTYIH